MLNDHCSKLTYNCSITKLEDVIGAVVSHCRTVISQQCKQNWTEYTAQGSTCVQ